MIDIAHIRSAYFIGAGGIGMSALIRWFMARGVRVAGYDRTPSPLTGHLIDEGAAIHFEDDVHLIPDGFSDPQTTLVVYTPAVPSDHTELNHFRRSGFEVMKRAEMLGLITSASRAICVAGTHGKTTVSSMTAHLLKQSHVDCNAFLGGILKEYASNLMLSDHSDLTVVEADEYDRSFHRLHPTTAIITSADPDHLDIYGTPAAYREAFEVFTSLIRPGGTLIIKKDAPITPRLQPDVRCYTYSATDTSADFHAENVRIGDGEAVFDCVLSDGTRIADIHLGVPVRINVENGVAAIAAAWLHGVRPDEIRSAMATFPGAERRFDIRLRNDRVVLIDDYAHHPEELTRSILSVKELYAGRCITGIFQPHLYSRTRDFADEFARSLSLLDELILVDIYPAREEPIPGVTSEMILEHVTIADKRCCTKAELPDIIAAGTFDVVLILGAGDIDRLVEPIRQILAQR